MDLNHWCDSKSRQLRKAVLFVAICSPMIAMSQQATRSYTLARAMRAASEKHKVIQIARRNVVIAQHNSAIASEKKLPNLAINGNYSRITNLTEWHDHYQQGLHYHTIPEMYEATGSISLPLYSGSSLRNEKKLSVLELRSAEIESEKIKADLQLEVASQFLALYKLLQLQGFLDLTLAEERERLKETQSNYKQGNVTRNEVLRAQLAISQRQQDSLTNQSNIGILEDRLRILVELPESERFVPDTAVISVPNDRFDFTADLSANHELALAGNAEKRAATRTELTKAAYFPTISLFGNYGLRYPNTLFFPQDPFPYTLGQFGIQLHYSITDAWRNRKHMSIARENEHKAEIEKAEINDDQNHRLFELSRQYTEMEQNLKLSAQAVHFATDNYRIVKAKYQQQMVLITEMTDADNALIEARYRHASNKANLILKQIEIEHLTGNLQ